MAEKPSTRAIFAAITWQPRAQVARNRPYYSTDGGTSVKPITLSVNGTSFAWTVPAVRGNFRRSIVKIIGYRTDGARVWTDVSDRQFTLESLKLTSPNGGETVVSGGALTVTWRSGGLSGITSTSIEATTNGGATWTTLAVIPGAGSGTWTGSATAVTAVKTGCKVRISLRDGSGTAAVDDSDAWCAIRP